MTVPNLYAFQGILERKQYELAIITLSSRFTSPEERREAQQILPAYKYIEKPVCRRPRVFRLIPKEDEDEKGGRSIFTPTPPGDVERVSLDIFHLQDKTDKEEKK